MSYSYYKDAKIKSYKEAAAWFAKGRKPEAGRALANWCRVFKVGDAFHFQGPYNTIFAVLTPDNVMTFPRTPAEMARISITFSQASHRTVPFLFMRLSTGRYIIEHSLTVDKQYGRYTNMRENAPEYFAGIQFDMAVGKCLNKRPRLADSIDDAARKVWLAQLRKFKRGMKVRSKMGVLQTICDQVSAERSTNRASWSQPDWTSDTWTTMLYTAIKEEQFPTELLRGFVMSSSISYWRKESPTPASTLDAVESVVNKLSIELCKRFGVFTHGADNE